MRRLAMVTTALWQRRSVYNLMSHSKVERRVDGYHSTNLRQIVLRYERRLPTTTSYLPMRLRAKVHEIGVPRPRASRSPGRLALREGAAESRHSRASGRRESGARGGGDGGGGGGSAQQRRWAEREEREEEEEEEEGEEAAVGEIVNNFSSSILFAILKMMNKQFARPSILRVLTEGGG